MFVQQLNILFMAFRWTMNRTPFWDSVPTLLRTISLRICCSISAQHQGPRCHTTGPGDSKTAISNTTTYASKCRNPFYLFNRIDTENATKRQTISKTIRTASAPTFTVLRPITSRVVPAVALCRRRSPIDRKPSARLWRKASTSCGKPKW